MSGSWSVGSVCGEPYVELVSGRTREGDALTVYEIPSGLLAVVERRGALSVKRVRCGRAQRARAARALATA